MNTIVRRLPLLCPGAAVLRAACLAAAAWIALPTAQVRAQEERIHQYDVEVAVDLDASLTVTETITVTAAGNQIQRGIYRDFPTMNRGRYGLRIEVPFEVLSVTRNGDPEPYQVEGIREGRRIRIGNPNRTLSHGAHVYEIRYRTARQIRRFDDHDELYWNAIGQFWDFPIDQAGVRVSLPSGVAVRSFEAYTGPAGAQGQDYRAEKENNTDVRFVSTRPFAPREGMTVVVTWDKGLVAEEPEPSLWKSNWTLMAGTVLLLAMVGYHLIAWILVGKDPPAGTIIPRFAPPDGFSPAAVRYLSRMGFDNTAFSAAVIDLGVHGRLSIKETGKKKFTLNKTPEADSTGEGSGLPADEAVLLSKLFSSSPVLALEQLNHRRIRAAREALKANLSAKIEKIHFVRNVRWWLPGLLGTIAAVGVAIIGAPDPAPALFMTVWLGFWTIGTSALVFGAASGWRSGNVASGGCMSLFAIPFVGAWFAGLFMFTQAASPWIVGLFLVAITVNVAFYRLIKAPTHAGRRILDEIEGFREYLKVAEEDRLNAMHPPKQTPELFERFLPYALALDCEQEWSEKFTKVLEAASTAASDGTRRSYSPAWYTGGLTTRELGSAAFASALAGSMTAALASSAQSPRSSSGSGGGGSSGGGGGGGGGGGW